MRKKTPISYTRHSSRALLSQIITPLLILFGDKPLGISVGSFFGGSIRTDHDLDHLNLDLSWWVVQDLICCVVHIQPRKHVLDRAEYTAPSQQHELDCTDHTDQESLCPEISRSWTVVGTDHLSDVCVISYGFINSKTQKTTPSTTSSIEISSAPKHR